MMGDTLLLVGHTFYFFLWPEEDASDMWTPN